MVSNGDGTVTYSRFGQGTLLLNTPTESNFDPDLPVGVIVLDAAASKARLEARVTSEYERHSRRIFAADPSNLTLIASDCSSVWSGNASRYQPGEVEVCWTWYKPADGDSDPNKNYRALFSVGTARGGNGAHVLEQATARNQVTQGNICCGWVPNGCCKNPSPGETISRTLSLTVFGIGGTISSSYTSYPDTDGQRFFDLAVDKHNYGWRGNRQCCQLIGTDGGLDFSYNQGGNWATTSTPFIQWHN